VGDIPDQRRAEEALAEGRQALERADRQGAEAAFGGALALGRGRPLADLEDLPAEVREKITVSPVDTLAEALSITIRDTTLRDGSQLEGISLTVEDKLRIAEQLEEVLGISGGDVDLEAVGPDAGRKSTV